MRSERHVTRKGCQGKETLKEMRIETNVKQQVCSLDVPRVKRKRRLDTEMPKERGVKAVKKRRTVQINKWNQMDMK